MHVMKSSLSGFLCSYVCATVFEWHRGVSLSAVPRSRGPALVVFLGATHTCVASFLCPLCASNLHTQKINEFRVDTNTLKPPPFIIKCDLCECTPLLFCPPVLRERTALPLITHTLLSATCGFRNLVLLCVSRNSPCNPQKTSANLPRLRGRVPLSGGGNSVCSYSGVCDISSSGSGNLEENIVKCGVITR